MPNLALNRTPYSKAPWPPRSTSTLGFTSIPSGHPSELMNTQPFFAPLAALLIASTPAVAQVKATVECIVSGTKASGEKSSKQFVERIQVESRKHTMTGKDGKPEEWGISNAELLSDGEKQKPSLIAATAEYAVLANAVTVGTGFERRLLVFTYMLDLKSMQLTRVVSSLPASAEERTSATCRAK